MQGSEMPPIVDEPSGKTIGRGLESVDEQEAKKDVMKTYSFEIPLEQLVNSHHNLTTNGIKVASRLASQLRSLPVHCAIELSNQAMSDRATAFAHHLYHVEKIRPGQVSVGFIDNVNSNTVRFVIERYEG